MKTLSKYIVVLLVVLSLNGLAQQKWVLGNNLAGVINYNKTESYNDSSSVVFINDGVPELLRVGIPSVLQVTWYIDTTLAVPKKVYADFQLGSAVGLDSLEIFILFLDSAGSWSYPGQSHILIPGDSGWKSFVWDVDLVDIELKKFSRFYFSFQFMTRDSSVVTGVIKMRNFEFIPHKTTGVTNPKQAIAGFELGQNYPNPFNPYTTIRFSVPEREQVYLTVYNLLGQEVKNLVSEIKEQGSYEVSFDASNLPSGTYLCRLQTATSMQVKKMTLLK